ncbi:hypothetical protein J2S40_002487 [Nocardioides luteus]|uniref:Gas vesicle protein n=1 Tax=Nocardioides luteus TaxID=1844 RepID=A0ABQ5T4L2_9ACTN|nr:gas vesicle protein GvpJ [Nocardioides luteus]MDR7311429.1 hypothetical protein [Nocardioides luteus]GGR55635.1 hypothetical protein GCM10010197_22900 [Nocardioides luteus]GLJ70081.1 hypothetical protein GCM10017579_41170 [Nocardioides luteus]
MTGTRSPALDETSLIDLVDRLIEGGVVVGGDLVLSLAGVDLVYVGLRLVIAPAHKVELPGTGRTR